MKVKLTKNFFHQNNWFFPGDELEGDSAKAAVDAGCAAEEKVKAAPKKRKPVKKEEG